MELTQDQIYQLMAAIIGGNVDSARSFFITTGAAARRNELLTTDRIVTRAINTLSTNMTKALSAVAGFSGRFTGIIGDEFGADEEAFNSFGKNLIQIVYELKEKVEAPSTGEGFTPTDEERAALDSGITAEILQKILDDLTAVFAPTEEQLNAMNSGITSTKLEELTTAVDSAFKPNEEQILAMDSGITSELLTVMRADIDNAFDPTESQLAAINSGVTGDILTGLREDIDNVFTPTETQLLAVNSGVTSDLLAGLRTDVDSKMNAADMVPMTEADVDEILDGMFA